MKHIPASSLYFDAAATSYPKPACVVRAVADHLSCGNPGRGSHRLANAAAEAVYTCREEAAAFFSAAPESVIFTGSATQALNTVLHGWLRPGDHVCISALSHNAVFRPVYALSQAIGITYTIYPSYSDPAQQLAALSEALRPNTRLIFSTHISNVCSMQEPIAQIGAFCRRRGLLFAVDAAQSAGHFAISLTDMGIHALCVPGHKGLLGPQGVGLLLLSEDAPPLLPFLYGGSGMHSTDPGMPEHLPEHLEAGTLPTPAIAGLAAGIRHIRQMGLDTISAHIASLSEAFCTRASTIPGLHFYGATGGSVLSFGINGFSSTEIGSYLNDNGILVRTGLHCAPLAHRFIGSPESGTVRVSFGYNNTMEEVRVFTETLSSLCV